MKTITYSVPNISCGHCTHTIKMELSDLEGVSKVDADIETRLVTIEFDDPTTEEKIKESLKAINYPAVE